MIFTGVNRPIDQLGRIVIPKEIRKTMKLKTEDRLDIFIDGGSIILKKHHVACVFCDDSEDVELFKGVAVCGKCKGDLKGAIQ